MSPLRYSTAVVLCALGMQVIAAGILYAFRPDPDITAWEMAGLVVLLGVFPLAIVFGLVRTYVSAPTSRCPRCDSGERRPAAKLRFTHNAFLWFVGGWLFAALWNARRDQEFVCGGCGALYATSTRGSRVAGILAWSCLVVALVHVVLELLN